jgi:hypothetical protein
LPTVITADELNHVAQNNNRILGTIWPPITKSIVPSWLDHKHFPAKGWMQRGLPFVHKGILQLAVVIVFFDVWGFGSRQRGRDELQRRFFQPVC